MCNSTGIFIVLALFFILFCDSTSSECTQLAPCICSLPDGQYYNLTSLADKDYLNATKGDLTVHFQPCKNTRMVIRSNNTACSSGNGVSLCMDNKENNTTLNLGTVEETHMKLYTTSNNKIPVFEVHHGNITSVINIVCLEDSQTHFVIDQIDKTPTGGKYHFILTSPYACKLKPQHGLSVGSVLLIIFFIITGSYFIVGAVVLKTLRGATGWEMMPNRKFWFDLPSLVKDGIVFTLNCCRADSYERI